MGAYTGSKYGLKGLGVHVKLSYKALYIRVFQHPSYIVGHKDASRKMVVRYFCAQAHHASTMFAVISGL
jgi:hypothetical protein